MAQFDETAKRRIRFQTRRGLLELDIVLRKFMANHFDRLEIFTAILALEDQEFLALINQTETPQRSDFEPLLAKIRAA